MDQIVALIVRLVAAIAPCARVMPGVKYARYRPGDRIKVLLAGYNRARNTGSDVRAVALGDERFMQFKKWYFFSWSDERNKRYQAYLDDLASAAATFSRERGFQPVIVGMEKLDEDACAQLAARLERLGFGRVPVILSRDHDGYVIGEVLRSLSLLVTSRYHAQVLASGANVPAVAVSMDERLDNLAEELGMPPELLVHVDDRDLAPRILLGLDYAHENRAMLAGVVESRREELTGLLGEMSTWFVEYLEQRGITFGASRETAFAQEPRPHVVPTWGAMEPAVAR